MEKTDELSKRPDWKVWTKKNNSNQTLIKGHWIHNLSKVIIKRPEVDIIEKIKIARGKDKKIVKVVEEIKKAGIKCYKEKNGR